MDIRSYAYSNARVKSLKSILLQRQALEGMMRSESVSAVVGLLENSNYRDALSEYSVKYAGADLVEFALGKNLAETYQKIITITPDAGKPIVLSVLERWDIHNLKTILLAKDLGYPNSRIEPFLVPAGVFGWPELRRMLDQKDVADTVSVLSGTKYSFLQNYDRTNIVNLTTALDAFYYQEFSRIGIGEQSVRDLVSAEIDARNLMLVLRAKTGEYPSKAVKNLLIRGGRLDSMHNELIDAKTVKEVIAKCEGRFDLYDALALYEKDGSLSNFEIALERRIAEKELRSLTLSVLCVGAIVFYIYLKEIETKNIRKIVRAKDYNLPYEKIKDMVIFLT